MRSLAVLVLLAGAARAQTVAPPALQKADVEEQLGMPVPLDLGLRDQTGAAVRLRDYFGARPVVLVLAYYRCPMLCGLVIRGALAALAKTDFAPGDEYQGLVVSFDPADDPAAAARAQRTALAEVDRAAWAERWPFLVGDQAAVRALADRLGFRYAWDPDTEQFAHPAVIFVLSPDGRVSRYLYGVQFRPRDLELAIVEAGQGKVGSFVDKVLLTCYRYDPATRRYAPYILGFVRIGALVIFAAVAGLLVYLWRRDRQRHEGAPA